MRVYCGIDWAEHHHDIAVVDRRGELLARRRIGDDIAGFTELCELLYQRSADPEQVHVALETDRGLMVRAVRAAGFRVYAVNPKSVDRYRDRYRVSGAKSDPGDAFVLAELLRTDETRHRQIPSDTIDAEVISVLARAHQDAIRERLRDARRLRSLLREYFPGALEAFGDLTTLTALAVLSAAPTPARAAALSEQDILSLGKGSGRWGMTVREAHRIHTVLHVEQLHHPDEIEDAFGAAAIAILLPLRIANMTIGELEADLGKHFEQHPDAEILRSLPGLGVVLGARVLSEFGDDPTRFADADSRRRYAGTAPITKASGKTRVVQMRRARNARLSDTCRMWAFTALSRSPGARAYYQRRRAAGDGHEAALRRLASKLLGQLHVCLARRQNYREEVAWPRGDDLAA
jgi:transposase